MISSKMRANLPILPSELTLTGISTPLDSPRRPCSRYPAAGFASPRFPLSDSVHIWLKVLNIMYIRDTIFKNLYFLMVKRHFVSGRDRVIGKERDMQRMLTAFCKAKGHLAFWTEQRQRGGSANGLTGSGT